RRWRTLPPAKAFRWTRVPPPELIPRLSSQWDRRLLRSNDASAKLILCVEISQGRFAGGCPCLRSGTHSRQFARRGCFRHPRRGRAGFLATRAGGGNNRGFLSGIQPTLSEVCG